MIIEKVRIGNAEPHRGDIIGKRPAMVVGQRRNNGEEWAYVMPTAAKFLGGIDARRERRRRRLIFKHCFQPVQFF